jgi:hypothetical protein
MEDHMNTRNLSAKKYMVLSLLIIGVMGLVGCRTLEIGVAEAKTVDAIPSVTHAVGTKNNQSGMETERGSINPIPQDQLPSGSDETSILNDEDAIRTALAAYHGMEESEFYHFEVKQNTGSHARGGVDNGYFLAAKVDGQWVFVAGGHAAPNCNEVARYGFPASMVPWCPAAGSDAPDCPESGTTIATFIADITYPDGTKVPAGENFTKTWRIKNVGTCTWDSDYQLIFDGGYAMNGPAQQQLTDSHVAPGETLDVSVELIAPDKPGTYRGNWKFQDPYGNIFGLTTGNPIWVEIKVVRDKSDQAKKASSNSAYPTVQVTDVNRDRRVTITGANFPPNDTLNVFLNTNGTKGIDGILVGTSMTDASGELIDIYTIPAYLRGQTIIAIRLESPTSGYYAYNWFLNE